MTASTFEKPPRLTRALLVLEGVPSLPALEEAAGGPVEKAGSPLDAARAVAATRPEVIAIDPRIAWQKRFAASLPSELRPAVLAVGRAQSGDALVIDEWLAPERDKEEGARRLGLAKERARLRRRNARRAFRDSLTGLPNRRASVRGLLREAERARRTGGALSLVLIDLDDFKRVNEVGGHPAGDRLLRQVGSTLRLVTRGPELCGRIGGDEFAVVVPAELEAAHATGRRLRDSLRQIGVYASVAACQLSDGETLRELYRRTDRGLKVEKSRKVSRVGASPEVPVPVTASEPAVLAAE
jgi:diguanylate cyclase (GGDEF)-like protein